MVFCSYDSVKDFKAPLNAAPLVNKDGLPAFEVTIKGEKTILTAKEVNTKFLKTLYASAQDFLGRKPDAAVFAIPLDFSSEQQEALKEASKDAGVEIKQFVPDVAAASIVYGLTSSPRDTSFSIGDRNILLLDIGASTTNATVLAVRNGLLSILSAVQDSRLGGDDLDTKLVEFLTKEFTKRTKVPWDPSNHRAVSKLYLEVESTKRTLSASTTATCAVESLAEGMDFSATVNRTRFDLLARDVYSRILSKATEAISQASLDSVQIHEVDFRSLSRLARPITSSLSQVILLGGTAKLPSLQSKIQDLFAEHTKVTTTIDPDEAVAKGAALQADLIFNIPSSVPVDLSKAESVSKNVPALSQPLGLLLGSNKEKNRFALLMDQNTPLPARKIIELGIPSSTNSSSSVVLSLWQGKHSIQIEQPKTNGSKANGKKNDDSEDEDEPEEIKHAIVKADSLVANLVCKVNGESKGKGRNAEPEKVRVTLVVGKEGKGSLQGQQGKTGEVFKIEF